jgi:hypothetical protein
VGGHSGPPPRRVPLPSTRPTTAPSTRSITLPSTRHVTPSSTPDMSHIDVDDTAGSPHVTLLSGLSPDAAAHPFPEADAVCRAVDACGVAAVGPSHDAVPWVVSLPSARRRRCRPPVTRQCCRLPVRDAGANACAAGFRSAAHRRPPTDVHPGGPPPPTRPVRLPSICHVTPRSARSAMPPSSRHVTPYVTLPSAKPPTPPSTPVVTRPSTRHVTPPSTPGEGGPSTAWCTPGVWPTGPTARPSPGRRRDP